MGKLDSRFIALPSTNGAIFVIKDGEYILANYIDSANVSHETWTMTLEDDSVITKEVVTWTSQG